MAGFIALLYGLGGSEESFGAVPHLLEAALGGSFAIEIMRYSARHRARSNIDASADQILTSLQTNHGNQDPIFLIGHSLGGLVARKVCEKLLFEGYKKAVQVAKGRKVHRPKQLHVTMEDDKAIAAHVTSNYTEDDESAGVIPGTHTNFMTKPADAAYVANVLLKIIRTRQNSLSRPHIVSSPDIKAQLPDRLLLIACSHTKRDEGDAFAGPMPAGWIAQESLRDRVIARRSYIYGILKDAKIEDGFERGGNRAHQAANRNLRHGPDFGGTNVPGEEGQYMVASRRYNGRIYNYITGHAWESYLQNQDQIRVLIMSGLYGLLEPTEWIQNYDVHLTDTHKDSGVSISSNWSELYTECLESYVRSAYKQRTVKIFDFLGDHHYVNAIRWHTLPKECSVFHFASPTVDDVNLLAPAGTIINTIFLNPNRLEEFVREDQGTRYELAAFGESLPGSADMRFFFESRVGITKRKTD
jgi:Peroxide stress protein YaaA/Thioesterase domain